MKLYEQLLRAIERFIISLHLPARTTAELSRIVEESASECAGIEQPTTEDKTDGMVTMHLTYAGESERYLKVKVQDRTYQLAKSRVTFSLAGDKAVVTMSSKYAASRKELVGQQ